MQVNVKSPAIMAELSCIKLCRWGTTYLRQHSEIASQHLAANICKEETVNMRNNFKRLFSLMLVVALVFALSVTTLAAGEKPLLTLEAKPGIQNGIISVSVNAKEEGIVADGKLVFTYDSAILSFKDVEVGSVWGDTDIVVKANGDQLGTVVVAFAANEAAKAGNVFTLKFEAVDQGQSTVAMNTGDSYITGADTYTLAADTTVNIVGFDDVLAGRYYVEGINYVVGEGWMKGVTEDKFAPEAETTRGMAVAVLYRMAGSPEVTEKTPFDDVNPKRYYADAVAWACKEGITNGVTETKFAPSHIVTREQMATFLARYAAKSGVSLETKGDLSKFVDGGSVKNFAVESMTWAVENGIINGVKADVLKPQGTSTRGQLATMIVRFVKVTATK